jgi:hypothetical protein
VSKRSWIIQERLAPDRPKWLHEAICPFCRAALIYICQGRWKRRAASLRRGGR